MPPRTTRTLRSGPHLKHSDTKLYYWFKDRPGVSYNDLAQMCVSRGYQIQKSFIGRIVRGTSQPSLKGAKILSQLTGIPIADFCQTDI